MKQLLVLFMAALLTLNSFSQKRSAGYFGGGLSLLVPKNAGESASVFPAFTITAGFKFFQGRDFSMVINAPVSVGWRFKDNGYLGIDLPVMLNMHFGSTAINNEHAKWGVLLGAGVGYVSVYNEEDFILQKDKFTEFLGYRANVGVQFTDKKDPTFKPLLLLTYGRSIASNYGYMVGIGIHFIFDGREKKSGSDVGFSGNRRVSF